MKQLGERSDMSEKGEQSGENLLGRVRLLSAGRVGSKRSIAQLLVSEGSGLARLSMAEVAQLTYTSKPSLVRFAQGLGFNGWPDFEDAFVKASLEAEGQLVGDVDPNFPFGASTPTAELASRVAWLERHAIHQVLETLDVGMLEEAAHRMSSARQVVYFAVAQNRYFGLNLAFQLHQIGVDCLVPAPEDCALVARGMGREDCALLVSYSGLGEKRVPAVLVPDLRDNGVPCVAVTNNGDNWLRHNCDCVLSFPPEEHLYSKVTGYYSETATMLVLRLLFSLCFKANYEKSAQYKLGAIVESEKNMQTQDVLPR